MLPGLSSCDGFVEMSPALVNGCVIFKHCQSWEVWACMGQLEGAGSESPSVSGQEQSKKPKQQPNNLIAQ